MDNGKDWGHSIIIGVDWMMMVDFLGSGMNKGEWRGVILSVAGVEGAARGDVRSLGRGWDGTG